MPSAVLVNDLYQDQGPVGKRSKVDSGPPSVSSKGWHGSRLFAPFRTVGLVSPTAVPFTTLPLGKTTFQITTSVGRCLQTYDLRRGLNLVFLSRPQTPDDITATTAWKDKVFAAWGFGGSGPSGIWAFKRGQRVGELETPLGPREKIRQLVVFGSWIVGCGEKQIQVWKSATYEHYTTLVPTGQHNGKRQGPLSGVVCNMPTFLNKIFAGRRDGSVEIWNLSTGKLIYTILPPSSDVGAVSALQPAPALSVLAIAFENGPLVVRDVRVDKPVIRITPSSKMGPVTSISFRTDGMGAGYDGRLPGVMATGGPQSGDVQFWDLNKSGRLMGILRGAHSSQLKVPGGVGGGVNKVEFLAGQPVIASSGLDNSLKSWIFDEIPFSPIPRILHCRSGHAAPVTRLSFLPSGADSADVEGKWLLSAGVDRSLWGWSLRRDGQSAELSQGNIKKKGKKLGLFASNIEADEAGAGLQDLKTPEIICIAASLNRDGGIGAAPNAGPIWSNSKINNRKKGAADASVQNLTGWESIITGHKDNKIARTWFWGRKRAGRWAFETGDGGNVTSVAITACGTFALVGSSIGAIEMFNLQSGQRRQRFPAKVTPKQAGHLKAGMVNSETGSKALEPTFRLGQGKHTNAVSGLMVDGINRTVISCGLDGKMKFWDFASGLLLKELSWAPFSALNGLRYHAPNDLIGVSCEDMSIKVIDIETKKVVRELRGCNGTIHDFCFSNDGRWIIASSAESVIRVWDLPTGHLVDAVRVETPCTALAFSNTGEFLATAHAGSIGINLWSNRTLFSHVPTRPISEKETVEIQNPTVSGEGGRGLVEAAYDEEDGEIEELDVMGDSTGVDVLSEDLMSLSLVPKSRWQTLIQLELIKRRNKPKEPPKAPEKAPFFLSSVERSKHDATTPVGTEQMATGDMSRIRKVAHGVPERDFTRLLAEGGEKGDYTAFITHLKSLSPAAADLEIRSLHSTSSSSSSNDNNNNNNSEVVHFVLALTERLQRKQDYELVQAWMTVFLRVHGELVATGDDDDERLRDALRGWRTSQKEEAGRLGVLMGYCTGVMGFLRSAT